MNTSNLVNEAAMAKDVRVTTRSLVVKLQDGRTVSVPVSWYPRLAHASAWERQRWELIGPGVGIHWPALDEDICVAGLLQGLPSGESEALATDEGTSEIGTEAEGAFAPSRMTPTALGRAVDPK